MEDHEADEFVPARAMQVVEEVLVAAVHPTTLREAAGLFPEKLASVGDAIWPALTASLRHPDPACRILAAYYLLKLAEKAYGGHPRQSSVERATAVMIDALKQDEFAPKLWACGRLADGPVPHKAIPFLVEIVDQTDNVLAVYAAAALTHCGEAAAHGLSVLTKAIYLKDDSLAVVAATALSRLDIRRDEAVLALVRRLDEGETPHQYGVLLALRGIGEPARASAPTLYRIARDGKAASIFRAAAAVALGSVCPNDITVGKQLVGLLNEDDWEVVDAALRRIAIQSSPAQSSHSPPPTLARVRQ